MEQKNSKIKIVSIVLCAIGIVSITVGIVIAKLSNSNIIRYAGYKFTIPENCTATIDKDRGLIVKTEDNNKYVIAVDYTNTFEDYKKSYSEIYYIPIERMLTKVEGREYLISMITDETQFGSAGRYATTVDNQVFSGLVVRYQLARPEEKDFIFINSLIDGAEKVSEVKKGSKQDIGRKSIEIKTFSEKDFS